MTSTNHTAARAIAFTFNDSRTDHPVDVLSDVGDALCTLSDLFIQDDVELSPRGADGIYKILRGCIATLDAVQAPIQERYSDPNAARRRETLALLDHEYRRGLREGATALVRGLERDAPSIAKVLRPWIADDVLTPTAPAADGPEPCGASYPRFSGRDAEGETGVDPGGETTERTGTDG